MRFYSKPYYGFIQGHAYIKNIDLFNLRLLVCQKNYNIVNDYESKFAKLIGEGDAVSYAAARMGFYELLKILNISNGDEVILLGSTCSVMVNAILKVGAKPIYSDLDTSTFGSDASSIEKCISSRTKIIVAQHSFGIPCDILQIVQLTKRKNIFLLEDCALTLGSTVNGIMVGNFGDAALFSTDHSKPINTIIGGLIYSRDANLINRLRRSHEFIKELSNSKERALWDRFLLERKYFNPNNYGKMELINLFLNIKKRFFKVEEAFLYGDHGTFSTLDYPYPAKLPTFLAAIGLYELKRWPQISLERKKLLVNLMVVADKCNFDKFIPIAYKDLTKEIVPLRFVWWHDEGAAIRKSFQKFVQIDWTWFMEPIIARNESLENLGYLNGACPLSEKIGPNMVNLPCNISFKESVELIKLLMNTIDV